MSDESRESTEKHLADTIDTFVVEVKKKTRKKSIKVIGISVAIIIVVVLLKKDKAMTAEHLSLIEDANEMKDKYDKLIHQHLDLMENWVELFEKHLDTIGAPKLEAV